MREPLLSCASNERYARVARRRRYEAATSSQSVFRGNRGRTRATDVQAAGGVHQYALRHGGLPGAVRR